TIAEEKLFLNQSQFINWMIGLASAGFLFLFSNLDKIKNYSVEGSISVNSLSLIVLISFIVTLIAALFFKIFKARLMQSYMYRRTLMGFQQASLMDKLDVFEIKNQADEWDFYVKMYELEFLPKEVKNSTDKKISPRPHIGMCNLTYWITILAFTVEFGCLFILLFHLIR
ncbi:MAG: hypothetical protein KDD04_02820, partial [Sinomicrobium sp.]|nr:hypothetical protein [Sinomicrobium sp.]